MKWYEYEIAYILNSIEQDFNGGALWTQCILFHIHDFASQLNFSGTCYGAVALLYDVARGGSTFQMTGDASPTSLFLLVGIFQQEATGFSR